MNRLPVCSGADAVKAFYKLGYEVDHQTGSHIILRHPTGRRLTVPNHRELAKGALRAIIREAGLTKGEFADHTTWLRLSRVISASTAFQLLWAQIMASDCLVAISAKLVNDSSHFRLLRRNARTSASECLLSPIRPVRAFK
jgi:predicted RNA binding protein YcfA (HicA-like mRNA interferase family)